MNGLPSFDISLFRFINSSLSNPFLDKVMPWLSANPFYVPSLIVILAGLVWQGGSRGRLCALFIVLTVALGDGVICNLIKHAVDRPRPFLQLDEVRVLVGRGESKSMPSSHAANSFAIMMAFFVFYRRSLRFTLPLALLISFSRIYNGVHFPSDVVAGAILGAGYTLGGIWTLNELWGLLGRKYFPLWWRRLPSLIRPDSPIPVVARGQVELVAEEVHWVRLGWVLTGSLFIAQILYLATGKIDLSEDEAYQWLWSKHLALSYYSKPPLIALTQWVGTHLCGDTEFGVRLFSPVISAVLSLMLIRFFATQNLARLGCWLVAVMATTPILATGATLMTVDPLLVLFWTAAMIAGWGALQPESTWRNWVWTGFLMGLGFLSKYTALFQLLSWVAVFAFLPQTRQQLRRPGPYLALAMTMLCLVPVIVWNVQHDWITATHVASDGKLAQTWHPTLRHLGAFLLAEGVVLNPFYVVLLLLAMVGWMRSPRSPLEIFLFWMGAPVFGFYLIFTLHSSVLPNWIAPCIVPFFCLGALRWVALRRAWPRLSLRLLWTGLGFGLAAVVILHDTRLFQKVSQRDLPLRLDPLRRVQGWKELGSALNLKRNEFSNKDHEVFLIGDHYGITSLMSFYLPEARISVATKPLVYYIDTDRPENQFYFWPNYLDQRPGESALFVQSIESPAFVEGWFWKWLREGDHPGLTRPPSAEPPPPPGILARQFHRVEDLGRFTIFRNGRAIHYFRLYYCEAAQPASTHHE